MPYTTVVTAPTHEPVTLDELKEQEDIPLTTTDHDALLWRFIRTARQACEAWSGKRLVTQTRDFTIDAFPPRDDEIRLPGGNLQSITSLIYTDSDDAPTTWAATNYGAKTTSGTLFLKHGKSWPTVTLQSRSAIVIRFVLGYGTGDEVDENYRAGILRWAGNLWIYREATSIPEEGFDTAKQLWGLGGRVWSQGSQKGIRF